MKSRLFLFLTIIASAPIAGALTGPDTAEPLALKDAVKRGLAFSLEVQKAESAKKAAEAEYRQARAQLFPTLELNAAGGTTMTSKKYDNGFADAYKARFNLTQPLYYGGVISAAMDAAELKRESAISKLREAKQDYVFKVVTAYYTMAQAQTLLFIAKENRAVLKSFWETTSRYARIGRSKGVDRLQAEASYNLSESDVLEAESQLEAGRFELARLLGQEPSSDQTLAPRLRTDSFDPGASEKLLQQALENNPSIRATELALESVIQTNKVKLGEHKPKLYVKGSWGYDSPDEYRWIEPNSEAYSLTVNLDIPLFSGFSSFAQSEQYNEERRQLEKDLAIKRQELRKTLLSEIATMQRDFQRVRLTRSSADSAKKAIDIAVRDYRNGLLSPTEVLNIQRTRLDADRQYTSAQYSYSRQILSVQRDLGADLEKIYQ